jgi:iron complex transport system substrate-binding protein
MASLSACSGENAITAPTGVSDAAAAGDDADSAVAGGGTTNNSPRACSGPATATADAAITPITEHAEPSLPVTYTDSRGKAITIDKADRVLALDVAGTLGTTVYALGLGDRLVGRDISTGVPALSDLPLVTVNGHELNGEAILNLDPDVVLTDYGIGPLEVQLQIEQSGIPVVIMSDQRSPDAIGPQIREVAKVFGVTAEGDQLARRVETDIAAAKERVAKIAPSDPAQQLRMAFLYIRGTAGVYSWLGKGSGADDLIAALHGVDIATEAGVPDSRPINAEALVESDPDLLLLMSHGLESVGGVDGLEGMPGIGQTDAGRNRCVVDMIDYQVLSFGPQFPATLDALATAIYERAAPA